MVEDDPDIVQMLRAFLQQEGFSVCHAVGQQGALALLAQDAVDLLLVDISLRMALALPFVLQRRTKICRWSS